MVNLKKYHAALKQFVLFLTFSLAFGCGTPKYHVTKIEGKEIGIIDKDGEVPAIEAFIKPYRDNIDKDMNVVLAYAPQTLDKSGEWQCPIGNLMADATLELTNRVFQKREQRKIDMCLLNFGGIRSIIPKGNVTTRTAFEIMPFENSCIVAELNASEIIEMIDYIIKEKKAHPISGLTFKVGTNVIAEDIRINGKAWNQYKTYLVVTSDYLINGGDNMNFFKKAVKTYDLDYKLRNVLIDYFKEKDTIVAPKNIRISKE